ncbi:MAG: Ig family protein, partial [bacterium]
LDGGLGADTLSGGAGNDVYVLDNPLDVVLEDGVSDPGGLDTVRSTVAHTLGERFENLVLLGSAPASATGNALSNRLTGNDADNTLAGGAGNDALEGRGGADSLR